MVQVFNDQEFVEKRDDIGNACQWLVDKLIPIGDFTILGACPGSGKSFLLELLACDVACGDQFMDFPTLEGDVLIIDEDNNNVKKVQTRIHRLLYGRKPKHQIFLVVGEGYVINKGDTQSIASLIQRPEFANVVLVIIDSLVSLAGAGTDMDSTSGSSKLVDGLRAITSPNRATVIVHHISAKNSITIEELQQQQHLDKLIMNGTRIVSACSDLLVIASRTEKNKNNEDVLSEILVRTHSRRDIMRADFMVGVRDINDDIMIMFPTTGEAPTLTIWEDALLSHFPLDAEIAMPELFDACKQFMSATTLYAERDRLIGMGFIELLPRRGVAGKHYFRLTKMGREWYMMHHDFTDNDGTIAKGKIVLKDYFKVDDKKEKESDK